MDAIQEIINEGRPADIICISDSREARYKVRTWYKIGVHDGYEYALEELTQNRIVRCNKISGEALIREMNFIHDFIKEHNCTPTISDAIEETRKQMIEKSCKIYCDDLCERSRYGMCYHKYDHKVQVKNDFKYSECETLKMFRKDMED